MEGITEGKLRIHVLFYPVTFISDEDLCWSHPSFSLTHTLLILVICICEARLSFSVVTHKFQFLDSYHNKV